MKRYLWLILLALAIGFFPACANAQISKNLTFSLEDFNIHEQEDGETSIQPLLTEGKSWTMWHGSHDYHLHNQTERACTHAWVDVTVDGEAEVEGKMCKRLHLNIEFAKDSEDVLFCPVCLHYAKLPEYLYGYEEDGKLYIQRNPGPRYSDDPSIPEGFNIVYGEPYFDMCLDFNHEIGDSIEYQEIDNVEYKDYNGVLRKVMSSTTSSPLFNNQYEWVEGIGSLANIVEWNTYYRIEFAIGYQQEFFCLAKCEDNGEMLYDNRQNMVDHGIFIDEFRLTGVESIQDCSNNEMSGNAAIYNLQGVKVATPAAGEVYIQNGKKKVFLDR